MIECSTGLLHWGPVTLSAMRHVGTVWEGAVVEKNCDVISSVTSDPERLLLAAALEAHGFKVSRRRSTLAAQCVVVLGEDAAAGRQLRALLDGAPRCRVIVVLVR